MAMSISMSSSMELLPVLTSASFSSSSTFSLCRYLFPPLVFSLHGLKFSPQRPPRAWTDASRTRSFRISAMGNGEVGEKGAFLEGSSGVLAEVIGMGSRKDAVLDFCLDSPFRLSSSLRFWSINTEDSTNVQLQERFLGKDLSPRSAEASLFLQSCSKTIILVVNAGFGLDFLTATDILRTIRSRNGLAVVVVLKPFSFEGQRRQDEVKDFVGKIQEHTNFLIDIDTDTLLKKDLVTLDEALKMANTAVLLAINAISVLMSEMRWKVIDKLHNVKEIKGLEVINILESQKEAKVGYGAGNSIKSSILQALFDCPFIGGGVQDLNGTIISIMASSGPIEESDVYASLRAFSQSSEFKGQIIVSTVLEPNLESNMVVSTIIAVGCVELQASQKNTILSRLAQHFPFLFNLLKRNHQESCDTGGNKVLKDDRLSKVTNSPVPSAIERTALVGTSEGHDELHNVLEATSSIKSDDRYDLRNYNGGAEENGNHLLAAKTESSNLYNQISEETPAFQREPLGRWNLGPGYQVAQEWAQERAGTSPMLDNLSIFSLPVGVRPTEELEDYLNISHATENVELKIKDVVKEQTLGDSNISSWGAFTDAGFLVVKDFYNNAYTLLKGRNADLPKKQGGLSVRAASMLEAERDSPKQWSPNTEMQYRGGVYRGRCQGGLPEGKGQLVLGDGSIYDGMWHYGRRSGLGTLYFCNGDMFQGSWRDDVMHGKGWFYFHAGDRWFANFWKGKANGESRFYSESGDVFFGHFQDGWRHGEFLCIDVGGARWIEIWNKGVLVSRKELDS